MTETVTIIAHDGRWTKLIATINVRKAVRSMAELRFAGWENIAITESKNDEELEYK